MKKLLFIFVLSTVAWSDTHTAASASYSDVSAAVALASDGDSVLVPSGTATWNSTLVVAKAVQIIGAGNGSTIINNGAGTVLIFSRTHDILTRLSGIRFNNSDGQSPIVALVGPMSKARVDHCVFNKGDCAIGTNFLGDPNKGSGPVYGVADHCEFYNMVRPYFPTDIRQGDSVSGSTAWTEPILPGSDKMMFFEDDQFVWDSNYTAPNGQAALYGQYGGKCCFRHNTCKGFCTYVDAHGDGPDYGTMYYEIYNDTFAMDLTRCTQGDIVWQRGGQWICHDNVVTGASAGLFYRLSVYHTSDLPAHRVQNSYFWNDTYYGKSDESAMVTVNDGGQTPAGYSAANIHCNEEYFLHAPQAGQAYYPYTPYTYPHPLTISGSVANKSVKEKSSAFAKVRLCGLGISVMLPEPVLSPELTVVDLSGRTVYRTALVAASRNAETDEGIVYDCAFRTIPAIGTYYAIVKETTADRKTLSVLTKIVLAR